MCGAPSSGGPGRRRGVAQLVDFHAPSSRVPATHVAVAADEKRQAEVRALRQDLRPARAGVGRRDRSLSPIGAVLERDLDVDTVGVRRRDADDVDRRVRRLVVMPVIVIGVNVVAAVAAA